jgi:hypothetical protein
MHVPHSYQDIKRGKLKYIHISITESQTSGQSLFT